jgi:hypothetical protein
MGSDVIFRFVDLFVGGSLLSIVFALGTELDDISSQ